MAKKKKDKKDKEKISSRIHPEVKKNVWIITFLGLAIIFILAAVGQAGPLGDSFFSLMETLFGWGYYFLPVVSFLIAFAFINPEERKFWTPTVVGAFLFVIAGLGLIDIVSPGSGGMTGSVIGSLEVPFGLWASIVVTTTVLIVSFLLVLNRPFNFSKILKAAFKPIKQKDNVSIKVPDVNGKGGEKEIEEGDDGEEAEEENNNQNISEKEKSKKDKKNNREKEKDKKSGASDEFHLKNIGDYKAPPLSLLSSSTESPTIGDLRASANIIARTLNSFGIQVDMGEIQVGPTVTRYTLKPAEGVKLSRITALKADLALALAAHPIRIEAPIPGKSLVGIEVPNKSAALVRLGSLLGYDEFQESAPLSFGLGRNVGGEPIFADIAPMPHLLVAGSTGSGKSITIHSMIISLIAKNSPRTLRMIMVDPKRVELSVYNEIPHLISPVIVQNKKAIGALNWTINEMEKRYEMLLSAGARDIKSYNKKSQEPLPYILIIIDELADLMTSYSREVEGAIIRLAQMSRATGIHLVVSTQRPSVEVITGLIKANITSRIALQVASQVDSRTILDTAGAESLLGNGDILFISSESSKPKRIQGAYITEKEIKGVVNYIVKNNEIKPEEDDINMEEKDSEDQGGIDFEEFSSSDDEDDMLEEAIGVVREAGKASASLLQRRLRVGYARAARLLDIMEEKGMIGPSQGAKPREVYIGEEEE